MFWCFTLGYIEQWGSGVARITAFCRQAGNPEPKLEESEDFVDWLFFRPVEDSGNDSEPGKTGKTVVESSEKSSEKNSEKSSEKSLAVLAHIADNPKISARAIAEKMGITPRMVEKHIARPKRQGVLIRVRAAKGGHWEIDQPEQLHDE